MGRGRRLEEDNEILSLVRTKYLDYITSVMETMRPPRE